jgi:putative FmdB family regulatory protein
MTYTYHCDVCGERYDVEQRITDDRLEKCPKCGAPSPVREINGGGTFILKGEGWYKDGYGGGASSSE